MLKKIYVLMLTAACASSFATDTTANANAADWSLNAIDAQPAWQITSGNPEIVVAIIDTGIDANHPDIKEALWQNPGESGKDALGRDKSTNGIDDDNNGYIDDVYGWDFTTQTAKANDTNGHGTHIAGIVHKVAPKVKLMILKYYAPTAPAIQNLNYTVKAIEYAVKMNAHVINYSGGGIQKSHNEEFWIREAQKKGILFVAAAGNERSNSDYVGFYPASYDLANVLSVTAVNSRLEKLSSSNFGRNSVDIAAPGQQILSSLPGGIRGPMTGTSQATAFATGVAALVISNMKNRQDYTQVKRQIAQTSSPRENLREHTRSGAILNSYRALAIKDAGISAFGDKTPNNLNFDITEEFLNPPN